MSIEVRERPLATFALFAYNQEKFIREAIEGALVQDYRPLQIILSDDCSTDGTFAVMQQMAAAYRGPHKVVLNRNEATLRIARHVNHIMELAEGELIVIAAGDDISLSSRCERTWQLWTRSGCANYAFAFGFETIDSVPGLPLPRVKTPLQTLEEQIWKAAAGNTGASAAWHRKVFDLFGPLPDYVPAEDVVIPFRGVLLGGVAFDPTPVVLYRQHPNNSASGAALESRDLHRKDLLHQTSLKKALAYLKAFAQDLHTAEAHRLITHEESVAYTALLQKSRRRREIELDLYSGSFRRRLHASFLLWPTPTARHYSTLRKLLLLLAAPFPRIRR